MGLLLKVFGKKVLPSTVPTIYQIPRSITYAAVSPSGSSVIFSGTYELYGLSPLLESIVVCPWQQRRILKYPRSPESPHEVRSGDPLYLVTQRYCLGTGRGRIRHLRKPPCVPHYAVLGHVTYSHSDDLFYVQVSEGPDDPTQLYSVDIANNKWEKIGDVDGLGYAMVYVPSKKAIYTVYGLGYDSVEDGRSVCLAAIDPARATVNRITEPFDGRFVAGEILEVTDGLIVFQSNSGTVCDQGPLYSYDTHDDRLIRWSLSNVRSIAVSGAGNVAVHIQRYNLRDNGVTVTDEGLAEDIWATYDKQGNAISTRRVLPSFLAGVEGSFSYNSERTVCLVLADAENFVNADGTRLIATQVAILFPMNLWRD